MIRVWSSGPQSSYEYQSIVNMYLEWNLAKFNPDKLRVSGDMGEALSCGCAFRDAQPHFLVGEPVLPNDMEGSHVGEGAFRIQSV